MVLRVLFLYIPLPMFWALYDQQVGAPCREPRLRRWCWFTFALFPSLPPRSGGVLTVLWQQRRLALTAPVFDFWQGSRWTIQAARMNMAFVSLIFKTPMTSHELCYLLAGFGDLNESSVSIAKPILPLWQPAA